MKEHSNIAIIGPKLLNEKKQIEQSFWRNPTLLNTILSITHLDFLNLKKNYYNYNYKTLKLVDTISGGAFFVRSSIFKSMKRFDANLFWMEDIDFCLRASKLGYKIFYHPFVKVIHFKGKSSLTNYKIVIINQLMSKIKFFKKHL